MMEKTIALLKEFGVPFAYDHFAEGEGPDPPFVCYRTPGTNNFDADGMVYYGIDEVDIELYTDAKDRTLEKKLEKLLEKYGICYEKDETFIESEKLYEVIYEFEEEA